jgi:hypothetical protein
MQLNRTYTFVEDTYVEGGRALAAPLKRVAVAAVIENPFAGRFVDDLSELMEIGAKVGELLGRRAVEMLEGDAVHSYGKAAIVGMAGEREHAAALLHPMLGAPLRAAVDGGKALIPSVKKVGGPGTMVDVPLHHKDAMKVRSHFDAMEVRVPDAPAPTEIVVVVAVTTRGRPHPRVGGLQLEDVQGVDGLG